MTIKVGVSQSGGTGFGGISLGDPQNVFDVGTSNKQAAESSRDTYANANATWLAKYQSDFDNKMPSSVLLMYVDATGEPVATYSQYNGSVIGWKDLSTAKGLRGVKGDKGDSFTIVSAQFQDDNIVFVDSNDNTITLANAIETLKGDTGASITSVSFVDDNIEFVKSNNEIVVLENAKETLQGDKAPKIISSTFQDLDIEFELEDETKFRLVQAKQELKGDKGDKPLHRWIDKTKLQFELPSGEYGELVDLIGPTLRFKGGYQDFTTYEKLDVVTYLNNVWIYVNDEPTSLNVPPVNVAQTSEYWVYLLTSNVTDTAGVFNDASITVAQGWSSSKIHDELLLKADNLNVLRTNIENPIFTPTHPTHPTTKNYVDDKTSLDNIPDTSTFVKMTLAERQKLANSATNHKGAFATPAALNAAFPSGSGNVTEGNTAYVLNSDGLGNKSMWSYLLGEWTDLQTSSTGDMLTSIYDPQDLGLDVYNMDNHQESASVKKFTVEEKQKLESLDANRVNGFNINATNRRNSTALILNGETNEFEYKDFVDVKNLAAFTGTTAERIALKTNPLYTDKFVYSFMDSDLQAQLIWHQPSGNFAEYRGQKLGATLPNNPTDGMVAVGSEASYVYDEAQQYWKITSLRSEDSTIIRYTWSQYSSWVAQNPLGTGVFYIIDAGTFIDYFGGVGVESKTKTVQSTSRPSVSTNREQLFVDTVGKRVYQWMEVRRYWKIVVDEYRDALTNFANNEQRFVEFNTKQGSSDVDNIRFTYDSNQDEFRVAVTTSRSKQGVKFAFRMNTTTSTIIKSRSIISNSSELQLPTTLFQDNVQSELSINVEKSEFTGLGFGFYIIKIENNIFITEKWITDSERSPDTPMNSEFVTRAERRNNLVQLPLNMREFWDIDIQKMLLLDSNGKWRSFNTKFEAIAFPANPSANQTIVSNTGDVYRWDVLDEYWDEVIASTPAPKNYVTNPNYMDTVTNGDKIQSLHYWTASASASFTISDIPIKAPDTMAARQLLALVQIQHFGAFINGSDNDRWYDGIMQSINTASRSNASMSAGNTIGKTPNATTQTDVDPHDPATTPTPTEYFKLIIGTRDNTFYFAIVAPTLPTAGSAYQSGMKFLNTSGAWSDFGTGTALPMIQSTSGFVTGSNVGPQNNILSANSAAIWMNFARITLH